MSELYENLIKATDNTSDITTEKYGTITKIENNLCNVKEDNADLEHSNVPILNGLNLGVGSKVVLGFVENNIYNVFVIGSVGSKDLYTREEIDKIVQDIISGQIDLSAYMKKEEYSEDLGNLDNTSQFLQALDNAIHSITGIGDYDTQTQTWNGNYD